QSVAGPRSNGHRNGHVQGLGLSMAADSSAGLHQRYNTGDSHATPDPIASSVSAASQVPHETNKSLLSSSRNRERLSTVKSAFLIYFALLGLSPILKSLTKSTAS